ncbi:LemA family protein [Patescibacteria group bacterium]|nr:LemA family protein [Patescibacteria group bacterium]MBU1472830.1 LemA family protein [Patescibacteria group bacterium]MBU2460362.1 LemA family protein [Patescibacteria group bacterium]MBU2543886.1 LemA family protein [Patescibacteria group bacterium]
MQVSLGIILGAVGLIAVYFWSLYNSLVRESTQIDEAWGQIDVQLKRRADLIPNLVESVKGYAKHEKSVFTEVTHARTALMKAGTPATSAQANDMLTGALKSLFAVAEAYPQLKANENFVHLQKELSDTEDKVAYARQYYNTQLMEYNVKVKTFPNTLFVRSFGFAEKEFFKTDATDRKSVKVDLH